MRKKKNLQPRMEACAGYLIENPEEYRGNWRSRKPDAKILRLELGCGKGKFTAETAAAHPEDLYIALERVPDAMVVAMERCRNRNLSNVFFIDGDAVHLAEYFGEGEVDLIYLNFCDPWPSSRHSRRRLTYEGFLREYRGILRDQGQIHFKTDNRDLFEWSLLQFPRAGYELSEVTRNLHENGINGIMTDYEEKFVRQGAPICRCVGTKSALPDVPLLESLSGLLEGWTVSLGSEEDLSQELSLLGMDPGFCPEGEESALRSFFPPEPGRLPNQCAVIQTRLISLQRESGSRILIGVTEDFPRDRTLFLNLLFLDPALRGKGEGRTVLTALLTSVEKAGYDRIRLACPESCPEAHRFFASAGFRDLRDGSLPGADRPAKIMEHVLPVCELNSLGMSCEKQQKSMDQSGGL